MSMATTIPLGVLVEDWERQAAGSLAMRSRWLKATRKLEVRRDMVTAYKAVEASRILTRRRSSRHRPVAK